MSSSTLPPSLKKINVFLKRAEELDRDKSNAESRVVAYNCRQYAVLIGIPLVSSSTADDNGAAKASLGQLLTALEKEKQAMSVFSKNEHWKICRKVADRVFEKADSEDRAGVANKGTARSFYAAGTFYEILQQFHDEEIKNKDGADLNEDEASVTEHIEEEDQRRVYCKWKATDILTAIKEGRAPKPGGYQQDKDETDDGVGGATNNEEEGIVDAWGQAPMHEDKNDLPLPPPTPSMPSSDLFEMSSSQNNSQNNTSNSMLPPPYDGIELSLSGQPTATTTAAATDDYVQEQNDQDLFIPAPPPQKPLAPPPAYSQQQQHHPTSTPAAAGGDSNNNGGKGMFSSIFQNNKSSNKKLSKEQMGDAIELTKFALAALQKGDGELGRERLEQALGLWR
eukprot:scaffold2671_cov81-Skeletonema_dohrnii-CCMP3373.AAC.3